MLRSTLNTKRKEGLEQVAAVAELVALYCPLA